MRVALARRSHRSEGRGGGLRAPGDGQCLHRSPLRAGVGDGVRPTFSQGRRHRGVASLAERAGKAGGVQHRTSMHRRGCTFSVRALWCIAPNLTNAGVPFFCTHTVNIFGVRTASSQGRPLRARLDRFSRGFWEPPLLSFLLLLFLLLALVRALLESARGEKGGVIGSAASELQPMLGIAVML